MVSVSAVREFHGLFAGALGVLQHGQEFTKNLRRIAAIDFLDDEHERAIRFGLGCLDDLQEDSADNVQLSRAGRTLAAHEVLVGQRGMELNHAQAIARDIGVL